MKKMIKFRTPYELLGYEDPIVPQGESMTVPGQAEPLTVLIERLAQGLPVTFLEPTYESDGQFSDSEYDHTDIDRDINDLVDGQSFVKDVNGRLEHDERMAAEASAARNTPPTREHSGSGSGEERSERDDKANSNRDA